MFSDFFYLTLSSFISEKRNLLNNCYDIQFSYSLENSFFRNVNKEGVIAFNKKYKIFLDGKGNLPYFHEDSLLSFFSSKLVCSFDDKTRYFFCNFSDPQDYMAEFESCWISYMDKKGSDIEFEIGKVSSGYGVPILNLYLKKKVVKDHSWHLELEER